ncbi:hypothetical protein QIU18_00610 [Capnocytophaga canimorsus]|nr:hypothetical protein [Capnocytophaga canimorsus]WGU70691.1 hypothetical protein QIU18_00610 [Capnocytophaga canimorsus]
MIETSFEKIVSDGSLLGSTGGRMMKNVWVAFKAVENDVFFASEMVFKQCFSSFRRR